MCLAPEVNGAFLIKSNLCIELLGAWEKAILDRLNSERDVGGVVGPTSQVSEV